MEREGKSIAGEIIDWVEAGMVAVVCVVLIFTFVVRLADVDGSSMLPTLENGDRLLITRLFYTPRQGDIIVISKPDEEPLIKRVIATGGQVIDIDFETHEVAVDGVVLQEDYISEPTGLYYDVQFPQTVPEGTVFVMGDNRNHSWDSRDSEIGMVDERYILGRAIFRLTPFSKLGALQ